LRLFATVVFALGVSHRVVGQSYTIDTLSGTGAAGFSGDGGPATSAQLNFPVGVAVDSDGSLYIADCGNHRIRKISNGVIITVAGNGTAGYSGDGGPALSAQLNLPEGVAVDSEGNLYIADTNNSRIRKVSNGVITTVAGTGTPGYSGDNGPALSAQLTAPSGIAVDVAGHLYIADTSRHVVRKVANWVITTVAGTGFPGFSGDNGPATSAQLEYPTSVAVDPAGDLYISDSRYQRVRKVTLGVITTVANGWPVYPADTSLSAQFLPLGVSADASGSVFFTDVINQRILKLVNGVITTVAGNGSQGYGGDDGPATSAQMNFPFGIAVDSTGNIFVADSRNNRIRRVVPLRDACWPFVKPASLSANGSGGELGIAIETGPSCQWEIRNLPSWITAPRGTSGTGPGLVTLSVAANTGEPRKVTIAIAGIWVPISQAGAAGGPCTYALSLGGQTFPATGGTGAVNVITQNACPWTATSSADWVMLSSGLSGTGAGSVSYRVADNAGYARSARLTIAGMPFVIQQMPVTVTTGAAVASLAFVAAGGFWNTRITLVNTGTAKARARLNFLDDQGGPLLLPLSFPQTSSAVFLMASTLDRTIEPGGELVIQTSGIDSEDTASGWAQFVGDGAVTGLAVFGWKDETGTQEAAAPLETRNPSAFVLWFDNTSGFTTYLTIANISSQDVRIPVVIRDDSGTEIAAVPISLPAGGHAMFALADVYPGTAEIRGSLELETPSGAQITALGIRQTPLGAMTSVPVLAK